MPIEIRELIIQAKMDHDKSSDSDDILANDQVGFSDLAAGQDTESEEEARAMDEERTEQIIDKCVARIKQWLMEKSQR